MAHVKMKVFPFLVAFALILALGLIRKDRFRPYEVLGIGREATQEEVKRAYRRLVLENHPDKNHAPDADEKFILIRRAYELLSDPWMKRNYDYNYDNQGVIEDYLCSFGIGLARSGCGKPFLPYTSSSLHPSFGVAALGLIQTLGRVLNHVLCQ